MESKAVWCVGAAEREEGSEEGLGFILCLKRQSWEQEADL